MGIRSFDSFSKPIIFTYKGEEEFTTTVGGIATIITSLLLFLYGGQQLLFLFLQPEFSEVVTRVYKDFTTNTDKLELDTENTTIALKMTLLNDVGEVVVDIDTLTRVQFFATEKLSDHDHLHTQWYEGIRCSELYAEEMKVDKFFADEFKDPTWICPNVRNITIYNNPFLFSTGQNFVAVINNCNVAVSTETE